MCEEADALQPQADALRDLRRRPMGQIDLDHCAGLIKPHIRAASGALPPHMRHLAAQQAADGLKHRIFRPEEKFGGPFKPRRHVAG